MSGFLDSRHLRLVAEVARTQSVTRAADRLHVTQSAVSHQLREIEARLGTPLFHRSGRRMVPTPAGAHLVQSAARVLEEIDRAESAIGQLARHDAGEFRVCTQCHTGYHWLPPLLHAVRRRFPKVEVRIAPEHTDHAIGALLDGKIDLAILNGDPKDSRLRLQPLFQDEHALIVAPGHPFAKRAFVTAEQISRERLFLYSRSLDDALIVQSVLRPARLEPGDVTLIRLTEAILEMVKAGLGVSVLPTWSIEPAIESGLVKAVRITKAGVFRRWDAATLAAAAPSPFLDYFVKELTKQGRRLGRAAQPA
jgi:LysR family transcriptional regulator for metE and metH